MAWRSMMAGCSPRGMPLAASLLRCTKSTASGWSLVRSGLLPGGRFEFVSASFSGDAKKSVLLGCKGRMSRSAEWRDIMPRWRPSSQRSPPARPALAGRHRDKDIHSSRPAAAMAGERHGDDPQQRDAGIA